MSGKKALVTAGPTHEYIDSVRFLGNASSGKMGYAIAEELAQRGAEVHLVSGQVSLVPHHHNITLHKVRSAKEMLDACLTVFPHSDITVLAAAVADFTPSVIADHKIKRGKNEWQITLTPTQDIATTLGKTKTAEQLLIGFALEDSNEMENAQRKLQAKNLDMIVLNSLNDKGAGFDVPTNKITMIEKSGGITHCPLKSKAAVAVDIVDKMEEIMDK